MRNHPCISKGIRPLRINLWSTALPSGLFNKDGVREGSTRSFYGFCLRVIIPFCSANGHMPIVMELVFVCSGGYDFAGMLFIVVVFLVGFLRDSLVEEILQVVASWNVFVFPRLAHSRGDYVCIAWSFWASTALGDWYPPSQVTDLSDIQQKLVTRVHVPIAR